MAILPPGDDLNIKVDNVKNGKAAWVDGIPPERLKYGGEEILNTCINYLSGQLREYQQNGTKGYL